MPSALFDDDAANTLPEVVLARAEGANSFKLERIAASCLLSMDILHTLCVMCSPDDYEPILRVHKALTAERAVHHIGALEEAGISVQAAGSIIPLVDRREDWKALFSKWCEDDWLAHRAAGYTLRWIISRSMDQGTYRQASLGHAFRIIEQWARKDNRFVGGSVQNLKQNIWPRYRPASHLWAAYFICDDVGIELTSEFAFKQFLSTAHWLLQQASELVPTGGRPGETILSRDDAWTIPERWLLRAGDGVVSSWVGNPDSHDIRATKSNLVQKAE